MHYRTMTIQDHTAATELWLSSPGVQLHDVDSLEGVAKYLKRNPGLSFVAEADGQLVGTIMAGHDGRRGYVQHLAVDANYRKQGIAAHLVALCLEALKQEGILKSHLMILAENEEAKRFWGRLGWVCRTDIETHSFINENNLNV